jgi:YegS/Rv2252/BmrU family lipid kinase
MQGSAVVYSGAMSSILSGLANAPTLLLAALAAAVVVLVVLVWWLAPADRPRIRVIPLRPTAAPRAAVIINPVRVDDTVAYRQRVGAIMRASGWADPLWLLTSADDTGLGMAREAVRAKVDVVFVAGGDGTTRACVAGLLHTGVPLALLPAGTGNLLARNLRLPMDLDEAVRVGLSGDDQKIDVGMVGEQPFTVMAGIGFDAVVMADAPERLKRQVGWPAYIVSGLRHLRDRRMYVTLRLDGGPPRRRRARMVVVGNVGSLQAGVQLLPDALPDDGILDVVVLAPKGIMDWARVGARLVTRRHGRDRHIEHHRVRRIDIEADRPEPRELDGDLIEPGTSLSVRIEPAALLVRVPGDGRPQAGS